MTLYIIDTLVIACTFSDILAQIDHPNWPKLDLSDFENDLQSDSTPFISYDRISFTSNKLNELDQYHPQEAVYKQ